MSNIFSPFVLYNYREQICLYQQSFLLPNNMNEVFMFCKTIILSNSSNLSSNAPKGILTLSKQNNFVKGKIRLYNLASLPTSSKLGLYVNQQVYTAQILKKANYYEFDLNENVDITQNLYCAIIDNATVDKTVLLEGGNLSGFCFSDSPTDAILEAKDDELELEISSALNNCKQEECCDCSNCEYKKYFYANQPKSIDIAHLNNIPEKQENIYHNDSTLIDSVDEVKDNNAIEQFQENVIETLENQVKEQISLVEPITKFEQDNISHKPTNEQTEFLNHIQRKIC